MRTGERNQANHDLSRFKSFFLPFMMLCLLMCSGARAGQELSDKEVKPVVLTIDGMCPTATFATKIDILFNEPCWSDYLRGALSPELSEYSVFSCPWTGEINDTAKIDEYVEKMIASYSELAKRRGTTFEIIAHSWGTVLSYMVLKQHPEISVNLFITLGSPLNSQEIFVRKWSVKYAGDNIQKPANVDQWKNYWAFRDLVSGSIAAADKNIQIDDTLSNSKIEERVIATSVFHSEYYKTEPWKTMIVSDLRSANKENIITISSDIVTIKGYRIKIGVSIESVSQATGLKFTIDQYGNDSCTYANTLSLPGIGIMLIEGIVARIDIWEGDYTTPEGAKLGDSVETIKKLYPNLEAQEHHYLPGEYYLVVRSPDNPLITIFETDGGKVDRFRIGRSPEIHYIEGCL